VGIVARGPLDEYRFNMFMRDLLAEKAKDIFRCKGVLAVHVSTSTFVFVNTWGFGGGNGAHTGVYGEERGRQCQGFRALRRGLDAVLQFADEQQARKVPSCVLCYGA
jgi:G3E family GTPase